MDPVSTLQSVKSCIDAAVVQMQAIANLHQLTLNKLPVYALAISSLEETVNTLTTIFSEGVPKQHVNRFAQLLLLELELNKFKETLDKCVEWHKSMVYLGFFAETGVHHHHHSGEEEAVLLDNSGVVVVVDCCRCDPSTSSDCWTQVKHLRRVFRVTPTVLEKEVDRAFEVVKPLLEQANALQHDVVGSAIEIQHPVLRRAWIERVGENVLNDPHMAATELVECLFTMLKREEGGVVVKEEFCKEMIVNFVRYLDGLSGSKPDERISIAEIKQFAITPENSVNVKGLLGLKQQPSEEEVVVSVPLTTTTSSSASSSSSASPWSVLSRTPSSFSSTRVVHSDAVLIPYCEGYGCNWPSKVATTFVVPPCPNPAKFLVGITVRCYAEDQGFGGTGHAQVRFQVNEDMAIPAFSVWRDKVVDGRYSFVMGPDKVKVGDTVILWACCPPWNAWSLRVSDVEVDVKFA